jgi:predicted RNA-binding Zn-ribbon protein involved in translation (DUF1610 family)
MSATVIAICSNPDCTRHAAAQTEAGLPPACPTCGAAMLARCWKCAEMVTDPFSSYCEYCGVPLKRILPRAVPREPRVAICMNPDCDWAVAAIQLTLLPSKCPRCGSALVSHCWKCGVRVVDLQQHYCQACGVPLKRRKRSA